MSDLQPPRPFSGEPGHTPPQSHQGAPSQPAPGQPTHPPGYPQQQPQQRVQQPPQQQIQTGPMQPAAAYGHPVPPSAPARKPMSARARLTVTWGVIGVMLLVTALAAIGALNRDVYGAGAFVGRYLDALAAKDAAAALEMPGVEFDDAELQSAGLPEGSADLLLRSDALSGLTEIEELGTEDIGGGVHEVRYAYEAGGSYGESTFYVKQAGHRFPLIPVWQFDESPLAVVNLSVQHSTSFAVNGFAVDTRQVTGDEQEPAFDNIVNLLVLSPGRYEFATATDLLESQPEQVIVDEPSQVHEAIVDAQPTEDLLERVQEAVNAHLDECATQAVLQPTGCPFGINIEDRVSGEPKWEIDTYPEVEIEPGEDGWEIAEVEGSASVDVDVQSLFDGSVRSVNERVGFEMTGQVYVQGDGSVDVQIEVAS
ncbi:hypothetical protein GCM10027416_31100 [Okibacterium endophyticum]